MGLGRKWSASDALPEDQSMVGVWTKAYRGLDQVKVWGDETTYRIAADFLEDVGTVEDWGCGPGGFRAFCKTNYVGIDGSQNQFVDRVEDLTTYRTQVDGILLRHVLEHNTAWRRILENAVASATSKLCIVLFTPFAEETKPILVGETGVPYISFRKEDLVEYFADRDWELIEGLKTDSWYGVEHVFQIKTRAAS